MVDSRTDYSVSKILNVLKEHPNGLSITDIAAQLSINRNSASKYLEMLQRQGSVDIRQVGAAKIYCPTRRLPVAAVRRFCSPNLVLVDHNLEILELSDALASLIKTTPEALIGKPAQTLFRGPDSSDDLLSLLRKALRGEEKDLLWHPAGARGPTCRLTLIPTVLETGRPAVSLALERLPMEDIPKEEHLLEALRQEALQKDRTEGVVRVSPDGRIRWVDEVYCRITGKSRDDLIGRPFQPPLATGGGAGWKRFIRNLTTENPTATVDCRMAMPDRDTRWYQWRGRLLCDADGRIREYQYLCSAIREHTTSEETPYRQQRSRERQINDLATALREAEARIGAVFDESPVGIAFCGMDGALARVNRMFLTVFGARDGGMIEGRNAFADLEIPSDILPRLQSGEAAEFSISYSRKRHRDHPFGVEEGAETVCLAGAASPVFFREEGTPSGFVLQLCDVTGRKKAEAALVEVKSRYRSLFETLAEGVVYLGADGRIIDANPSAEYILGCSLSDMLGRTFNELRWRVIHEDGTGCSEDLLPHAAALATGIPARKTLGIFNPREGGYHWLDTLTVPRFRPGEENPFQTVIIFCDITERKAAEEAYRESEKRYRILVESMPDVTFLLDPEGHLLYVNAFGAQVLHRPMEEIIGKSLPELFPNGQGAQYRRNVASAAAAGTIINNISRLQLPDGEVWYDTRLIPVGARDGTCRYVMGIARDITARKQAEEVSRKHAERFRSIFEESPLGIAVCDPEGGLLHVNRACLELFGIADPSEIRRINLPEICRRVGARDMQALKDTVTPFECLLDFDHIRSRSLLPTTRTGSIRIEGVVSPLRSADGGAADGYLLQMYDVTSRVLAEGALRESHDWLAGIARHLPDAMFAIDLKGVVITWNLAMEELTGILAEEVLGKGNYEYALPFYGERMPMLVDKVLKPAEALRNSYRSIAYAEGDGIIAETVISIHKGDSPRIWWVKAAPLYDSRGEVVGAVESIRDITEQRRAEEALKKGDVSPNTALGSL